MAEPTELKINFIRPGKGHHRRPLILITVLALVLAAGWCWHAYRSYGSQLADMSEVNTRLHQELEQIRPQNEGLAEFQGMERDADAIRDAIDSIIEDKCRHAALLEEIYRMAPTGMSLTEIEATREIIKIKGFCLDYSTLGGLLSAADLHPHFGKVRNVTSDFAKPPSGQIEFVVEVDYKGVAK
ncbi:MAG: PilN domain-containing protein [Syntrophomonadaceae bacterium]